MTINLNGNIDLNKLNLLGGYTLKPKISPVEQTHLKVKKLKEKIINDFLVPLYSNQWNTLKENIFFLNNIQKTLNTYYNMYKSEELLVYIDLFKVIYLLIEKHNLLEYTEEQIYGREKKSEVMCAIFKTIPIKLLPEYEIYNSIIGKPNKKFNEKYDDIIISDIKIMLLQKDINYAKMKNYIDETYKKE